MIYSVHGYYGKQHSRKAHSKIEAIVFARSRELAEDIVKRLFDNYPVEFEYFSIVGGQEQDLNAIYEQRPELRYENPDRGYIYNEFSHKNAIYRYFK